MTNNIEQVITELEAKLKEWCEELHVPGCSVGMIYKGNKYTATFGVTNVDHPLDVTPDTLFQIGSITKTYTALVIMQLVEQGKIALDAPVRQYLPDFSVKDEAVSSMVTVQHLITHTAGWVGDVFTDTGDNDDAVAKYVEQMAELEQLAPPDTAISYNNSAFLVAGRIVEVVTEMTVEDAIRTFVFEPLALEHSYFFPKQIMTQRFAVGHRFVEEAEMQALRDWQIPRSANSIGGIICDIHDLLKYGEFHLGNGTIGDTKVISSDTLAKMHTVQFKLNEQGGGFGLGWGVGTWGGKKIIGHSGGTNGQVSDLRIIPDHDFVFAMVTNAYSGGAVMTRVENWLFEALLGLTQPEPEIQEPVLEQLQAYVGMYSRPILDTELLIEDGKLMAQIHFKGGLTDEIPPDPPPFEMRLCGTDEMTVIDGVRKGAKVEFLRNADGKIAYMRLGGRLNKRV